MSFTVCVQHFVRLDIIVQNQCAPLYVSDEQFSDFDMFI